MSNWSEIEAHQRQLGREVGTAAVNWGGRLPVALIYANTYSVGMSSLGYQTLYAMLAARPDMVVERVFDDERWDGAPAPLSLETQRPLDEFAVWAFSLSFELDYLNAINLIRRTPIPALADEREEGDPILLAGGPAVSANPLPLAEIFDAFVLGEAEELLPKLLDLLAAEIGDRTRLLRRLSELPGVYVPAIHGRGAAGPALRRLWVRDLDRYPTHSVMWTPDSEFGDMHLVEITRGCRRGCRFCLAGHTTRPWRERSLPTLQRAAAYGRPHRDRVGLVGAAVSDYAQIDELVGGLREAGWKISVSSLRADSVSELLLDALAASGTQTVTVAPEAGSEWLRTVIGKGIREEDLLRVADLASARGFAWLKLYFMLGLPGETDEDVAGLIALTERVRERFARSVSVNVSPFVPKAHTPFQWEAAPAPAVVARRLRQIEKGLRGGHVRVRSDSADWAGVQAVLARGDARLTPALLALRKPSLSAWRQALREAGLDEREYLAARPLGERLPWERFGSGMRRELLVRGAELAGEGKPALHCPGGECTACGVCA